MNHLKIVARFVTLVLAFGMAFATLSAQAAVPQTLNYQGQLTSAGGVPVNATVSMTFKLYDVETGGAALWSETQSVTVSNGLFNVVLGNTTPVTLGFDVPYYLGIKVGTDAEMAPRQPLTSVGTALMAKQAGILSCTGCVDTAQLADGSVTAAKLVSLDALQGLRCRVGQLCEGTVSIAYDPNNNISMQCTPETYSLTVNVTATGTHHVYQQCTGYYECSCGTFCTTTCSYFYDCGPNLSNTIAVSSSPAGIAFTGTGPGSQAAQFCGSVTLTATTDSGGSTVFSGDCTGTGTCTLTVDGLKTVNITNN